MELLDNSVKDFSDALASRAAVPGGGGASALVGALGASLGTMVGELTVGKAKYAAVEDDVKALMSDCERIRTRLLELVEEDARAFAPLAEAYSLPKDAPGRDETMERCLSAAAAVPMEILELCCESIKLMDDFAKKGAELAISDAGCGAVLCWAAMYASALNVLVNTKLMKDKQTAERMNARVSELMNSHWKIADATYEGVYGRLS